MRRKEEGLGCMVLHPCRGGKQGRTPISSASCPALSAPRLAQPADATTSTPAAVLQPVCGSRLPIPSPRPLHRFAGVAPLLSLNVDGCLVVRTSCQVPGFPAARSPAIATPIVLPAFASVAGHVVIPSAPDGTTASPPRGSESPLFLSWNAGSLPERPQRGILKGGGWAGSCHRANRESA